MDPYEELQAFDVSEAVASDAEAILDEFIENQHSLQHESVIYAAAAALLAAQKNDYPLSLGDTADQITESFTEQVETEKQVIRAKSTIADVTETHTIPTPASSYVPRYADDLDLPEDVIDTALEIIEMSSASVVGRAPASVAAAAVYAAGSMKGYDLNQDDVGRVSNVSPVTIRNIYGDMLKEHEVAG